MREFLSAPKTLITRLSVGVPVGILMAVIAAPTVYTTKADDFTTTIKEPGHKTPFIDASNVRMGKDVIFVDYAVEGKERLRAYFDPNAEVYYLDGSSDGVKQIAAKLANHEEVDTVHIISHGDSATLQLGNTTLDTTRMESESKDDLSLIGNALSEHGDILIYGCDFGKGLKGQQAVSLLAKVTGADVAASDNKTGASRLNGDWKLEIASGSIEGQVLAVPGYPAILDLAITEASNLSSAAMDLANNILGEGVTVNSAIYKGDSVQSGVFTTGAGTSFGNNILGFTSGSIFSTGKANAVAGPNNNLFLSDNALGGIDDDPDFDLIAGTSTEDASWIEIKFTPDVFDGASVGDTGRITMEIVFGSEEYNEFVYADANDAIAVIVNGVNKALTPNGQNIGIDTINNAGNLHPSSGSVANDPNPEHTSANFESANPSLYRNNSDSSLNTQMNGVTTTIPVSFEVVIGEENTLKIGVADARGDRFDSWLFVKKDSAQTVIVAENDTVITPSNVPANIDVVANDFDLQGDVLTVTHINDQPISSGNTTLLSSGISVKLENDGTFTINGDGTNTANDLFTYSITDGNGGTSIAFVTVTITEPDLIDPIPTILVDDITADNIINHPESIASVAVTGTVDGEFNTGDSVTLSVNGNTYTGPVNVAGGYSIEVPGSELAADTTIEATIKTQDGAGNTGSATVIHTHSVDTTLPEPIISVNSVTDDNSVNAAESAINIDVSGTVSGDFAINDSVTLVINGNSFVGAVDTNGLYTINVAGADLAADTTIDASVSHTDGLGNTGTGTTAHTYTVDTGLPVPVITINDITADNIINRPESLASVDVTGTVGGEFNTADIVTLSINGNTYTGAVDVAGVYSIPVPGSDLASDLTIEATVSTQDAAGNEGSATTPHIHSVETRLPIPIISVNDITDDNGVNAAESAINIDVSGTVSGDFATNDSVTLVINGNSFTGVVDANGIYTINVTGSDLAADATLDASIVHTDDIGNVGTGSTTHTHTIDTGLPVPVITVNDITADNVVNAVESGANINVTGSVSGDFVTGDTVTLSINANSYMGQADGSGNYTISVAGSDLEADTTVDASISTLDVAGNPGSANSVHTHAVDIELPVPTITVDDITADNIINATESDTSIAVTGVVAGDFNSGDTVTLLIDSFSYAGIVDVSGNYSMSVAGSDLAADTTIDASVSTTNSIGNIGTATTIHTHKVDTALSTVPTVVSQTTEDSTPVITGTAIVDTGDTLTVTVAGATYTVVPNTAGEWSINTGTATPDSGFFFPDINGEANDVAAVISDVAGNASPDTTSSELIIDSLKAADDVGSANGVFGGQAVASVLANDRLEGSAANIAEINLGQVSSTHANIALNTATGSIDVAANTPEALYTLVYEACEKDAATNCETATVEIDVLADKDRDYVTDDTDLDTDNDGIPDAVEQLTAINGGDTDNDGILDEHDLDSDGDGISDLVESGLSPSQIAVLDTDQNGVIDTSTGDNGLADALETDDTVTAQLKDAPVNTDGDSKPDFQDLDSDNDSIHDLVEGSGLDPLVVDEGNDGVVDSNIHDAQGHDLADTDSDGLPDYRDRDADEDGIFDLIEAGHVNPAVADANNDGVLDNQAQDSDDDGIPDSGDKAVINYGDPQITLPVDSDEDSFPDYRDLDSDNDSLPDVKEAGNQDDNDDGLLDSEGTVNPIPIDTDNDGAEDFRDVDSDNAGESDIREAGNGELDVNNDGRADNLADPDRDGIPSVIDGEPSRYGTANDSDKDGVPNGLDLDDDNDGLPDLAELDANGNDVDTDGDGISDRLDRDSDSDGIPDAIEAIAGTTPVDQNGDGVIDNFVDTDGDGLHDAVDPSLKGVDTNNDSTSDFRDLDSDNDGLFDLFEASTGTGIDTNVDGKLDTLADTDRDGLADVVDTQTTGVNNQSGLSLQNPDTDADSIYDFRDLDSDDDQLSDRQESGSLPNTPKDDNNNGTPDYREAVEDTVANAPVGTNSDGTLETAVSGSGGSFGGLASFLMLLLLSGLMSLRSRGDVVKKYVMGEGRKTNSSFGRFIPFLLTGVLTGFVSTSLNEAQAYGCSGSYQADGFTPCTYVGGGIVSSHVDPEGEANGWSTSNDSDSGFNLYGGYHFKPHWFAELGYTDLGDAVLNNAFPEFAGQKESISYKVPSAHLGYFVRDPSKQLNVYGKAGFSSIRNKASSKVVPFDKQTKVQLSFGLGAQWQAKESPLFARVGADFHDKDAIAAGVSVGYKFGARRKVAQPIPAALPNHPRPAPVSAPVAPRDSDGDGYPDNIDRCPHSKRGAVVDRRGCEVKIAKPSFAGVLEGVNFHTGSAVLTPMAESILRNVARQFKKWPNLKAVIVGHTDNVGSDQSNMSLSFRRAQSVTAFLIQNGVQRSHLVSSVGMGERQPRATNATNRGRAQNRRVELLPQ